MNYDLIVIGGGPAGYVGAIRAAQLGKKVACVENDRAGGTCLNWGCIPTKALLKNAELYHTITHRAEEFGLKIGSIEYDWSKVIGRSRNVSDKLNKGIEFLFKKNKIDYLKGTASIPAAGKVEVTAADGKKETHDAANILITTGAKSRPMPGFPFNGKTVIGSKEAMTLEKQPKSIIVIGAGAIGIEFAYFFNAYGTKVTVVEMLPDVLPVEDTEVSKLLEKSLTKSGIRILTNTKVTGTSEDGKGVKINVEGAANETLEAEVCLVAIGVAPVLPGGIEIKLTDRGWLHTDDRYQTSVKGIYGAGDIIGPPWLAHVASYEAVQCVEGLFTKHKPKKVTVFPGCTYCHPQVASIGLTERAAKEKGLKFKIGKFPYVASGKALAAAEPEGFVKILYGEPHGEILGAHIIGSESTEMIAEIGLAMNLEATWDEIEATIHAHPTLSEMVKEATEVAKGHPIHV
ncbi:dihydrolipoyl dehydrogenase [Prosthecobacter sp.]|uniref:dihydrolipoyl dehydrogenase n=1 Tax=Prosthecobacter sp. TaxID=1965333 RepID=UPI002ABC148F|nr:dihydrolipoyl dehydrogenase [Prosthecobacter sp.]MDZ4401233.1 dihydrolipoyl dehydrogenase [Prosthecobacter sp.]